MPVLMNASPNWVEADPFRSIATDALGLQSVADELADHLLPGISVLTTRARYFTFLCWARKKCGIQYDEEQIHRFEMALLYMEAQLTKDGQEAHKDCRFVGSLKIRDVPLSVFPPNPKSIYKTPVWRSYRASMVALGLLKHGKSYPLTELGKSAAEHFEKAVGKCNPARSPLSTNACLSRIDRSRAEKQLLRRCLGLQSVPAKMQNEEWRRREAFIKEVRGKKRLSRLAPETILPLYEHYRSNNLDEVVRVLRMAAIWEYLSIGLNGIFTTWAHAVAAKGHTQEQWRRDLLAALKRKSRDLVTLERIELQRHANVTLLERFVNMLRHAHVLHDGVQQRGAILPGDEMFGMANALLTARSKDKMDEVLEVLLQHHENTKGEEAWIYTDSSGKLKSRNAVQSKWKLPTRVGAHAYRFSAFDSLCQDLGGLSA